MLSIIIPTLNEEKYLPKLLESIKKQSFEGYEIIVTDANSKDKTVKIAKTFGCKIIKGGIQARGINNGAKAAKYNALLILDADVSLPTKFLAKNFKTFKKKNLDVAQCYIKPKNGKIIDELAHMICNIYYFSFKRIRPFIPSFCFFIKKDFFFKVGGFNEKVPWFADLAFSNALPKQTKNDVLPVHIEISVRMTRRLGRFRQAGILFLVAIFRLLKRNYYAKYKFKSLS